MEVGGSVVVSARDNEGGSKAKSHKDVFTGDVDNKKIFARSFGVDLLSLQASII